jgi:RimJ/RimL family protein N-acetyltransferase
VVELATPRLILAEISPADFDDWKGFVSDFDVVQWTGSWPFPMDPDFLTFRLSKPFPPERGIVTSVRKNGQIIGTMALTDGQLGYMFRQDAWGQGYASEAARAVLDYGFQTLGLEAATAGTFVGNQASENVLRKLGFKLKGEAEHNCRSRGGLLPGLDWTLSREDYLAHDPIFVKTKRLHLRNMTGDDAAALRAIVTNPKVGPMLIIYPPDWTEADAREHVESWSYQGRLRFRVGIEHQGRLVGAIGAGDGDEVSIFYFFDPETHGQGFASELVPAFCDALTRRFNIMALKAGVFTDNPASARVLEKAGFAKVGEADWKSSARSAEAPMWQYRRA